MFYLGVIPTPAPPNQPARDRAPKLYRAYHFPAEVISHAVWLYARFALSYRDVKELL